MLKTIFEKTKEAAGETDQDSNQVKEFLAAFGGVVNEAFSASGSMATVGLSYRSAFRKITSIQPWQPG